MEPTERYKNISDIVTSWIGLTAVLFSLYIGLYTYLDSQSKIVSDKNKTALSFVERFDSPAFVEIRKRVDILVSDLGKKAKTQEAPEERQLEIARVFFYEKIALFTSGHDYYKDVQLLISYFDQAWMCVELKLCDREAISLLLGDNAKQVDYFFRGYIEHRQKSNSSTGKGLEAILSYEKQ